MFISTRFQAVSSRHEGRLRKCTSDVGCHVVTRKVWKSLTCRAELAVTSNVCNWHTKLREVLRCQAVKALIHRGQQFEGDALWIEDALQLVSHSSWHIRKQCVAIINLTGHERMD